MISASGKRFSSLALSFFGMALLSGYAQTVAKPPVKTPASGGQTASPDRTPYAMRMAPTCRTG